MTKTNRKVTAEASLNETAKERADAVDLASHQMDAISKSYTASYQGLSKFYHDAFERYVSFGTELCQMASESSRQFCGPMEEEGARELDQLADGQAEHLNVVKS